MQGSMCPDTPSELFDAAGLPLPARPTLAFGVTAGKTLPCDLERILDDTSVPYRMIPVAPHGYLALYDLDGVVTGEPAILRRLRAIVGVPPAPPGAF
jgi:hypothetical protein